MVQVTFSKNLKISIVIIETSYLLQNKKEKKMLIIYTYYGPIKTKLFLKSEILYFSNYGSWEKATLANLSET